MPKTFSDSERAYIKARLMEEAKACLAQFGIRKTTVDELVKWTNIPKGTFYLFYPSKEMLFFELFCAIQDQIQADMLYRIDELQGNITVDTVTEFLFGFYKQVDVTFVYAFAASGELELLARKLPPEVVKEHVQKDDFSIERLLSLLPGVQGGGNYKIFSAALRAIFCAMSHKREIGEDVFDDAIRVMLRGVVAQLLEGESL